MTVVWTTLLCILLMVAPKALAADKAICRATGGAHYRTFDRKFYNFVGNCEYMLAKDTGGNFEISTKNRQCKGPYACVESVSVRVKGITISMKKGDLPTVSDVVVKLPYRRNGIVITKYGPKTRIRSDLGFHVIYNGVYNVFVTVLGRYRNKMRGLCGNYNGKRNDEYIKHDNSQASNAEDFGNSWKIGSKSCPNKPQPQTPCLNGGRFAKDAKKKCGLLRKRPFSQCHSAVDVDDGFIESCEYDVCACKEHPLSCVCEQYAAYATSCEIAGIVVKWKHLSNFRLCASPCASDPCLNGGTCSNKGPFSFRCACLRGFKGKRCGIEASPCASNPCQNGGTCSNNSTNTFTCVCSRGFTGFRCETKASKSTCMAAGDPHYRTFDGRRYDYMGDCEYTLAKDTENTFEITAKNRRCRGRYTCTVSLSVAVNGLTIRVDKGGPPMVNGIVVNFPYRSQGVVIKKVGRRIRIKSNVGFVIRYNGVYNVFVTVFERYRNKMRGLCGNFNGKKNDDIIKKDGNKAVNIRDFGNSWKVNETCPDKPPPPPPCSIAGRVALRAKKKCALLKEPPFSQCHGTVDVDDGFIQACEFDVCACNDHPMSCLCEEYEAYATACEIAGVQVEWKHLAKFKACSSPCASDPCLNNGTCSNKGPKTYSCACAPGFTGVNCENEVQPCDSNPCKNGGRCTNNGTNSFICLCSRGFIGFRCETKASKSTCMAAGDPHYRTFDGKKYDFMGDCEYTLAKDTGNTFEITTKNRRCRGRYTCTVSLSVAVKGLKIRVNKGGRPRVNGRVVRLPYRRRGVVIKKSGLRIRIKSNVGFIVRYNGVYNVFVTVFERYRNKMRGLCGNFNGKRNDDFIKKNGNKAVNIRDFANSWKVNETCPDKPPPPPPCSIAGRVALRAKKKCALLKEPPFSQCHGTVNVDDGFIQACEFDVCACNDHPMSCLCEEYEAYATACDIAGVQVEWKHLAKFKACSSPCASDPCLNNGTCSNKGPKTYSCACTPGFTGVNCENEVQPCNSNPCKNGGTCSNNGTNSFTCLCSRGFTGFRCETKASKSTCMAAGDPHYRTFDGRKYDFMGDCEYTLAKDTDNTFEITTKNRRCRGRYTCTVSLSVAVKGLTIRVDKGGRPRVNGRVVRLPYRRRGVVIKKVGRQIRIKSNVGFIIRYNGVYNVFVTVFERYRNKMLGLCGNFNGKRNDDFIKKNGKKAVDITEFGNSWKVNETCPDQPPPPPPCSIAGRVALKAKKKCALLKKPPFSQCHDAVNVDDGFIQACEFDVCACNDHPMSCLCEEYEAYATACAIAGVQVEWKHLAKFKACSSPCASDPCLHGGTCTNNGSKAYVCACTQGHNGQRCENGTSPCDSYPCLNGGTCSSNAPNTYNCSCTQGFNGQRCENNTTPCNSDPCLNGGTCSSNAPNTYNCLCTQGFNGPRCENEVASASCSASGDPHYRTFDGKKYSFMGSCQYTLAKDTGNTFEIWTQNKRCGHRMCVESVSVSIYSLLIRVEKGYSPTVSGVSVPLPYMNKGVLITKAGKHTQITSDVGFRIEYNGLHKVNVIVYGRFRGKMRGLCGNFNEDGADEFLKKDGTAAANAKDFGNSWKTYNNTCH